MTHGTSFAELFSGTPFGDSFSLGIILLQIGFYLFYSYVQYILSKKLEVKYSWMAWVPVLSLFNLVKIAGKSYWWVLWIILGFIAFIIPGLILSIMVLHAISKRTGHNGWWTVGLVFAKWLFLPVTAFHYQKGDEIAPRPFTGWKKGLLIFFGLGFPIFMIFGILAAAIFPAMTGYLQASRDAARVSHIHSIRTSLDTYFSDYEKYPDTDPSGCLPVDQMNGYIYGRMIDPIAGRFMNGCDGSNGQTYAYRKYISLDGKEHYVVGVKMEGKDNKNGNSNEGMIDNINSNTSFMKGAGPYLYIMN